MTSDSSLGRCPACGAVVPSGLMLAEYERADGEQRRFAEYPECGRVVAPKSVSDD